jgi:predicted ribosome quality control (RQC) complex YloA/Tae2 family protein
MAIALDSFTIGLLARELDGLLRGKTVRSVLTDQEKVLTIEFSERTAGRLRFCHDPSFPVLCLFGPDKTVKNQTHVPRFEEALKGCAVERLVQIDLERVVRVDLCENGDVTLHLYLELTPPFPNVFLTDRQDRILATLFRAGTQTRTRKLARGVRYSPPVPQRKSHPLRIKLQDLEAMNWQEDDTALSKTLLGISPFFSKEIAWRAAKCGSLAGAFGEIMEAYRRSDSSPHVFEVDRSLSKSPPHIGLAWYRPMMGGIVRFESATSVNKAAAAALGLFLSTWAAERQRKSVLRALARHIRRWQQTEQRAREALAESRAADHLRRAGELLIVNLPAIRRGSREIRVSDLYSEDQKEIVITLQPNLTPQANAQVYFSKARKMQRRARLADQRLRKALETLKELCSMKTEAEHTATSPERMDEIENLVLKGPAVPGKEKKPVVDDRALRLGIKPRRYSISGGWTVLVGRSARENDILTHRYAAPSDIWFHAKQAHGSHVILRREKKKVEPSKGALIEAASIAAYYSKARTSKHVPVSYTEKRYVKKMRKGPPGLCTMLREKVVFVEPHIPGQAKHR